METKLHTHTGTGRAYWAQIVALGLIVGLGIQFAQAAWTNPPAGGPTSGNVSGPITTSSDAQTKTGNLFLGNDLSVGRYLNVTSHAYLGDYVVAHKTNGLCLGPLGSMTCKKSWSDMEVPAGAVVAFNLSACPAGWNAYNPGRGRVIVGLNDTSSNPFDTVGNRSGRTSVTLASENIPASDHYHNIIHNAKITTDTWSGVNQYLVDESNAGGDTEYDLGGWSGVPNVGRTSNALDGTPGTVAVDIMNPYVVLRYCVKS